MRILFRSAYRLRISLFLLISTPHLLLFPFFSSSFLLFSSEIIRWKSEKPRKYKGLNEIKRKLQDIKRRSPRFTKSFLGSNFFCFSLIFSRNRMMRNWQGVTPKFIFLSLLFLLFPFLGMKKETLFLFRVSMFFSFSFYFREYPVLPFFDVLGMKGIVSLH